MTGQAPSPWDGPSGFATRPRPRTLLRAVLIGAGRSGQALARDLRTDERHGLLPVAVLDEASAGAKTAAGALARQITRHEARAVVLADPSLPPHRFRDLADAAVHAGAVVRYLPWYAGALHRDVTGADLLPLDIRALIDGPPPHVVWPDIKEIVTGKRVLVTGAGGVLGSELCRQLHAFNCGTLFLLDRDEQALHRLRADVWGDELATDIQEPDQTSEMFRRFRPEIVFHAAGLRQASVLERRPSHGVKANVLSTDNLVRAAAKHGTERFLHISTDADPATMLGASERVAEAVVLGAAHKAGNRHSAKTVFAVVRIGDVLDARDSLLTTLPDQIRTGGPLTITHPDASRIFATVEEAVALALEAGRMATGGEVYSLGLGEPMLITEVVTRFTRQYKLPEVPIRYVGVKQPRSENSAPVGRIPTAQPQIFVIPTHSDLADPASPAEFTHLSERLDKLYKAAAKNRDPKVRQMLAKLAAIRQPSAPAASDA